MTGPITEPRLLAGRYRVDGLLGRGGMSEVFHGYDERLDRRVAIKMLRSPLPGTIPAAPDSPEAAEILDDLDRNRKRFLREIRTAAQLEHPGIPSVYDTGVEEGPAGETQLWLVMQLLRGSTLESALDHADYDSKAPSVAWAAAIAAQIAAVLTDVHRVDIVHRDIKPANVMLIDGGLVKVLDFGIAILHGAGALPRLTQVDRTVGTPAYMSPEQNLGKAVTSASDIYSLGCLLYELLTGDAPFHGTKDMPLRAHHLQSAPPSVCGLGRMSRPRSTPWSRRCWPKTPRTARQPSVSTPLFSRWSWPRLMAKPGTRAVTRPGRFAVRCWLRRRAVSRAQTARHSPRARPGGC